MTLTVQGASERSNSIGISPWLVAKFTVTVPSVEISSPLGTVASLAASPDSLYSHCTVGSSGVSRWPARVIASCSSEIGRASCRDSVYVSAVADIADAQKQT